MSARGSCIGSGEYTPPVLTINGAAAYLGAQEALMATLEKGQAAPAFSLRDQDGKTVKLSDFKGKKVLLYFYPKADTPGCTRQSCSVRDARQDMKKLSVEVLGISPDTPEDQKKFDVKYSLGFPLLADTDHAVAEAYGVWGEKSSYGKTSMGIIRSSFLIDEQGKVLRTWYKVKPEDTVPKAQDALKELEAPNRTY
jgi:peroxiredoxin Q/BCP